MISEAPSNPCDSVKISCTTRGAKHCNALPTLQGGDAPSPATSKLRLDGARTNLSYFKTPLILDGVTEGNTFEGPPRPKPFHRSTKNRSLPAGSLCLLFPLGAFLNASSLVALLQNTLQHQRL